MSVLLTRTAIDRSKELVLSHARSRRHAGIEADQCRFPGPPLLAAAIRVEVPA
jgi:hypothetical protein